MKIEGELMERVIALVTRIAIGELKDYCQYGDIPACLYCSWTAEDLNNQARTYEQFAELMKTGIQHDTSCPIVQARSILGEVCVGEKRETT